MITLYSGIPRSGKSYKMVADLLAAKDKFYIVQNIEGLNLSLFPHIIDFRTYIDEQKMEFNEFFSKEFQEKFCDEVREKFGLRVLVVIDESHEWFDRSIKALKMWLSYHGHIGQTIWMVSHRSSNLSSSYRSFIELEYRAKSGSMIFLPGFFMYNRISGGVAAGYKFEKKRQEVFDAYKSQNDDYKAVKKSNYMPAVLALGVLAIIGFLQFPKLLMSKPLPAKVQTTADDKKNVAIVNTPLVNPPADFGPPQEALETKYAFIGIMGNQAVLEDRKTGNQFILSRVPYGLSRLENSGSDSLTVWSSKTRKVLIFYNCDRYEVPSSGRPLRPEDGTGSSGFLSLKKS